jgi:hypothetical protein
VCRDGLHRSTQAAHAAECEQLEALASAREALAGERRAAAAAELQAQACSHGR